MKKIILSVLFLVLIISLLISQGYAESEKKTKFQVKNLILKSYYIGKEYDHKDHIGEGTLSLEELIENSDIIVLGKVISSDIETMQIGRGDNVNSRFSSCSIKISKVLKGDKNINNVSLAMPPLVTIGKEWPKWEGLIYTEGLEGLWFLTKSPYNVPENLVKKILSKGDYHFANGEGRYREYDEKLIEETLRILKCGSS